MEIFTCVPGSTSMIKHKILVTDDSPFRSKACQNRYALMQTLKMDITGECDLSYTSPVVIGYRKLNHICMFYPEPMNDPHFFLQQVARDANFSKIGPSKSY